MITELQEKEIIDYLMSKNLSLDILLEIKDHIINQVEDCQNRDHLHFEDAFSQVKDLWSDEFKMTYYPFYSMQIPVLAKNIVRTKYNRLLKKSFLIALAFFGINLILIYCSGSQEIYKMGFRILNGLFFIIPFLVLILHYKNRILIKKDERYKGKLFYTMYQTNISLLMISTLSMVQVVGKTGKYAYEFFRNQNDAESMYILITLILPFIMQMAVIFALFNFFEHKRTLKKMNYFLYPSSE